MKNLISNYEMMPVVLNVHDKEYRLYDSTPLGSHQLV